MSSVTLIIMCVELCPSSVDSKLPGSPADSQLEQMSMEGHTAQWNRAPTISIKQLRTHVSFAFHMNKSRRQRTVHILLQHASWLRCLSLLPREKGRRQENSHSSPVSSGVKVGCSMAGSLRVRTGFSSTTKNGWDGCIS